jgi:hypothetical protein
VGLGQTYYEDIKLFSNLPVGLPKPELQSIINEFRAGDLHNSERFIVAHTRMATKVALGYGFFGNRGDDLVGIAMIELCKFPSLVQQGNLKDDNVIRYLLSRLHCACRDFISVDRIFGPSRGHVNNTGIQVKREFTTATDSTTSILELVGCSDKSIDFYTDMKGLCQTVGDEKILDFILAGYNDEQIKNAFGWRSTTFINQSINGLIARYKQKIIDDFVIWLPYPCYKSSVYCMHRDLLHKQCRSIEEVLQHKWVRHPASLMWRGHHYQLCNYAMYCAHAIDMPIDKFVRYRDKLPESASTELPTWFDDDRIHSSHRSNLLRKYPDYYSDCDWVEKPTSNYYWPVLA